MINPKAKTLSFQTPFPHVIIKDFLISRSIEEIHLKFIIKKLMVHKFVPFGVLSVLKTTCVDNILVKLFKYYIEFFWPGQFWRN